MVCRDILSLMNIVELASSNVFCNYNKLIRILFSAYLIHIEIPLLLVDKTTNQIMNRLEAEETEDVEE